MYVSRGEGGKPAQKINTEAVSFMGQSPFPPPSFEQHHIKRYPRFDDFAHDFAFLVREAEVETIISRARDVLATQTFSCRYGCWEEKFGTPTVCCLDPWWWRGR